MSGIAWSANETNCPYHPRKNYTGRTKVANCLSDEASMQWVHLVGMRIEIITYLLLDLFSKWVETYIMPSLHSWRATEFLYDDLVIRWGKPHYIWTDNSAKFVGSFAWLCKRLGIVHYHITIGNSKANRQVEWIIRTLKDCIWHGLIKEPVTF